MAIVYFPAPFLKKTNVSSMTIRPGNLLQCLEQIIEKFPDVASFIFSNSELVPFIKIFINRVDSNKLDGLDTHISNGDELQIVFAVAGG
ncbi:MAG: MoaD family protein [Burkholderiales bacterium]|jgi:molybdopterin converting factor small subunit|nr:MoaD family protein [Burkholderiales bacterium]